MILIIYERSVIFKYQIFKYHSKILPTRVVSREMAMLVATNLRFLKYTNCTRTSIIF